LRVRRSSEKERIVIDRQSLIGQWRLVSFVEQRDGGAWTDALGPQARGCIGYWDSGHMQVLIGASDRPRFRGAWDTIPVADKARCLDRMVAYSGRFTVASDRVLHHVDVCWIPNWEGRDLVRLASFPTPNRLLLRTEPATDGLPRPMQEVLWERLSTKEPS
jgi:hypothetical protein